MAIVLPRLDEHGLAKNVRVALHHANAADHHQKHTHRTVTRRLRSHGGALGANDARANREEDRRGSGGFLSGLRSSGLREYLGNGKYRSKRVGVCIKTVMPRDDVRLRPADGLMDLGLCTVIAERVLPAAIVAAGVVEKPTSNRPLR